MRAWPWIPGPLASLASRNDSEEYAPCIAKNDYNFKYLSDADTFSVLAVPAESGLR